MIDVAALTVKRRFADAAQMAEILGNNWACQKLSKDGRCLGRKDQYRFLVPRTVHNADFIGTPAKKPFTKDGAINRADTLKKPWPQCGIKATKSKVIPTSGQKTRNSGLLLYHNWVVNTPNGTGIADRERQKLLWATGHKIYYPFLGVFVTGNRLGMKQGSQ